MTDIDEVVVNTNRQAFNLFLTAKIIEQKRAIGQLPTKVLVAWLADTTTAKIGVNITAELLVFVSRYKRDYTMSDGNDAIAAWLDEEFEGDVADEFHKWIEEIPIDEWVERIAAEYGKDGDGDA